MNDIVKTNDQLDVFAKEIDQMKQMATILANANMLPTDINTPEKVFFLMQQGKELGLTPMQAINNIYVINGRTAINTNMMTALIKRSGKYKFTVKEWTSKICTMEFFERNNDTWESLGEISYTKEEAEYAGFFKPNYKTGKVSVGWARFPKEMMKARCISRGARLYCADVIQGMYDIDELKETEVIEAEIIPATKEESNAASVQNTIREVYTSIEERIGNVTKLSQLDSIKKQIEKNRGLEMFNDEDYMKLSSLVAQKEQELNSVEKEDGTPEDIK